MRRFSLHSPFLSVTCLRMVRLSLQLLVLFFSKAPKCTVLGNPPCCDVTKSVTEHTPLNQVLDPPSSLPLPNILPLFSLHSLFLILNWLTENNGTASSGPVVGGPAQSTAGRASAHRGSVRSPSHPDDTSDLTDGSSWHRMIIGALLRLHSTHKKKTNSSECCAAATASRCEKNKKK